MPKTKSAGVMKDNHSVRTILVDTDGRQVPAGVKTEIIRPWGEGDLTSNGEQYGTATTSSGSTETDVISSKVTVGYKERLKGDLARLELSLTWAVDVDGTPTDNGVTCVYARQDHTKDWIAVMTSDTQTTPSAYTDVTFSGVYPIDTVVTKLPFDIKLTAKSSGANDNCLAKPKSSSWIKVDYWPE